MTETIGYKSLSNKLGSKKTKYFNDRLAEQIQTLCLTHNAETFKLSGSSAIIFFAKEDSFLNFITELRELARSRVLDMAEFPADIRMWAHCGQFSSDFINKQMADFNNTKSIDIFRLDKYADKYDAVISGDMSPSFKKLLLQKNIDALKQGKEKLKGFDKEYTLYKMVFPENDTDATELLAPKMVELEKNSREIPIFGNLYPPMTMGKNFIHLDIKRGLEDLTFQSFKMLPTSYMLEENAFSIDLRKNTFYKAWKEYFEPLDIRGLYKNYRWAIILGSPGSGKTTLLKYFTFREFKHNREMKKNDELRLVLYLQCRHMISFDLWHCFRYGDKEKEMQPVGQLERPFNVETVLNYLTFCFLYKNGCQDFDETHLKTAERLVQKAYCRGKLSIMLDALDETRGESSRISEEKKEKIVECLKLLFEETKEETRKYNRFYLTSRYSEQDSYFNGKNATIFQPHFEIRPMDMEQLRDMAKTFYGETSTLYQEFDQVAWRDVISGKIGGTPLIASIALANFQKSGQFDTKYNMYNTMITLILERALKKSDTHNNTTLVYDALSLLSFNTIDISKVLDQDDITGIFQLVFTHTQDHAELEKEAWDKLQLLVKDGLLISVAPDQYVFSHSTIMEFLAARFIVEKLLNPNYMDPHLTFLEFEKNLKERDLSFYQSIILPLAVGSGIKTGAWLLLFLKHRIQCVEHERNRPLFFRLALKSLAEFECIANCHELQTSPAEPLLAVDPQFELARENSRHAAEWIYQSLARLLLSSDKNLLKRGIEAYKNISRLCQPVLLQHYLDYHTFTDTDSETLALREQLLDHIIREELKEIWRINHLHHCDCQVQGTGEEASKTMDMIDTDATLLTLNTHHYHPEDKNFNYYHRYTGKLLRGFLGSPNLRHSAHVNCVTIMTSMTNMTHSPDSFFILSGSSDHTIKCWQLTTGKEIHTFTGHTNLVTSLALAPNARFLFSGSFDNTIKCWDVLTAQEVRTFKGHLSVVTSVTLSPNGQYLLSGSWDKTVKCWELETGQEVRTFKGHSKGVTAVAISPDGRFMFSGSEDNTVKCWNMDTGQEIRTLQGHNWKVTCIALTPNGQYLLSGSMDDTVICWDAASGEKMHLFKGHHRTITSLTITVDARFLFTGSLDHTVKCWDLKTGHEIRTFKGFDSAVTGVAVTPDARFIVSSSEDRTVKCWELDTGKEVHIHGFKGHKGGVSCLTPSLDGKFLFSGSWDKTIKGWELTTGKETITFKGHSRNVSGVALTPDSRYLFSGSFDHRVKCWETATGKEVRTFIGHSGPVTSILLTPDTRFLLSGSYDHMIKCWDLNTGKEVRIFKGHEGGITAIAQTADGKHLLSGSYDNTIRYWEFNTGKLLGTFSGHDGGVTTVTFTPDGKFFFSGAEDRSIKYWELAPGTMGLVRTLVGHNREVTSVAVCAHGRYLVSSSNDHDIKIWNIESGECIKTIPLPWIIQEIKELPTQPGIFATANDNRTITLFDLNKAVQK